MNENCVYHCSYAILSVQLNMDCISECIRDAEYMTLLEEINRAESYLEAANKQQKGLEDRTWIEQENQTECEAELEEEGCKAKKHILIEKLKKRKLTIEEEAGRARKHFCEQEKIVHLCRKGTAAC